MKSLISVVKCIISHQTISTSQILSPSFHPPVDLLILMNQVGSKLTGLILNYPMPSPPEDWTVTPLLGCMHKRIEYYDEVKGVVSKIKSTAELTLPRIQSRRKGKMGRFFKDQTLKFLCEHTKSV